MNNSNDWTIPLLSGLFIGFILGSTLGVIWKIEHNKTWQKQAIEHNAAQYHPKTGVFEWVEVGDE